MKKLFFVFVLISIVGCSKQKLTIIEKSKVKELVIEKNYSVIYCECETNELLNKILGKLREKGFQIISINSFENMGVVKTEKNIVLYGYTRKVQGDTKKYTTTNLVNRNQRSDCGKGCTISKSWNELIVKTVTTPSVSRNNSVLIYKIDDSTELLMAVTSGNKYSLSLSTTEETGGKLNVISETKAYVIK